jgi:IS30 family transposase
VPALGWAAVHQGLPEGVDGRADSGREMAEHQELAAQLAIDVYFCDPRSSWQRGSNENANRLLRQYFAKGADLRRFSPRDLDDIARRINTRPRRVLDWATSAELFWPHVHAEYVP